MSRRCPDAPLLYLRLQTQFINHLQSALCEDLDVEEGERNVELMIRCLENLDEPACGSTEANTIGTSSWTSLFDDIFISEALLENFPCILDDSRCVRFPRVQRYLITRFLTAFKAGTVTDH